MIHGRQFNHLGRPSSHRKAVLKNLAISLITNKKIVTTLAKAKAARKFVEGVINLSKDDSMHSRRLAFSKLGNKNATKELFDNISKKISHRNGGYTRILKMQPRWGDNAKMAIFSLVDF